MNKGHIVGEVKAQFSYIVQPAPRLFFIEVMARFLCAVLRSCYQHCTNLALHFTEQTTESKCTQIYTAVELWLCFSGKFALTSVGQNTPTQQDQLQPTNN